MPVCLIKSDCYSLMYSSLSCTFNIMDPHKIYIHHLNTFSLEPIEAIQISDSIRYHKSTHCHKLTQTPMRADTLLSHLRPELEQDQCFKC